MNITRLEAMSRTERARANATKSGGVHYTPPELAAFVAGNALAFASFSNHLRVLDPACGDGALMKAIAELAPPGCELELVGCDKDSAALEATNARLTALTRPGLTWQLEACDFLSEATAVRDASERLFGHCLPASPLTKPFDIVIANPPYVRTQTLGAEESRRLAEVFGLTGRVDLYHAFAVAMTESLQDEGVLALLCSNRFMTTKGGSSLRRHFLDKLDIQRVFDLGDTKLFDAAVLPAVVVACRRKPSGSQPTMVTIYESHHVEIESHADSVLQAVAAGASGTVRVGRTSFEIKRGRLESAPGTSEPWVLTSEDGSWLRKVEANAHLRFGDLGKIRVGIKTTADKVFIRDDWHTAEEPVPESELLLPLITHHVAARWVSKPPIRRVLYPYDITSRRRVPVDLEAWPHAHAYLELHRARLEARSYVVQSGREWWEIWVPQRPSEWAVPKLVFPDISDQPRFSLDLTGSVVNGDCYWLTLPSKAEEALGLLAMAIANSSLGVRFYDQACGNRLYSGRRRYITQYVERFPVPDPNSTEARSIVELAKSLARSGVRAQEVARLEAEIDALVWRSFGFEEIPR
jgi:adenine-specific DNA-methyltransferase